MEHFENKKGLKKLILNGLIDLKQERKVLPIPA
jgi:hypothetical protein